MLKIKDSVDLKELEKFGFKKVKNINNSMNYDDDNYPYYRCISRGSKFIFANHYILSISDWDNLDPRIHKKANCKYSSLEEAEDIVFDLIQAGLVEKGA